MFMSSCGFQNLTQRVSRRASLTAVARIPEVGGRDVELGPRRLDHAGGRLERPEEGAPDRHLDRDDVPEHVDPVQPPVNVGKQVAHPDDHIAQLLTPVALWPDTPPMPLNTPSSANRSMNPWTSRTSPSARWYARRTSASVSVCHCHLPSGHRSGRIKVHRWDGERPSPDSGDCRVLCASCWPGRSDMKAIRRP